jgi:Domain of unknown function (DUF4258)
MGVVFSNHAILEINRRKIKIEYVERLINNPPQKIPSKKNQTIVQGKYHDKDHNKEMLLRIIGEELEGSFYVITACRTSKIEKYWKGDGL